MIDGERCVVFGEVKWLSREGRGQGIGGDKGQMQLRREFLTKYGSAIYGPRGFVVLGVALSGALEEQAPEDTGAVATRGLTWAELSDFERHPARDEFARYYEWKSAHSRTRG